LIAHYKTKIY